MSCRGQTACGCGLNLRGRKHRLVQAGFVFISKAIVFKSECLAGENVTADVMWMKIWKDLNNLQDTGCMCALVIGCILMCFLLPPMMRLRNIAQNTNTIMSLHVLLCKLVFFSCINYSEPCACLTMRLNTLHNDVHKRRFIPSDCDTTGMFLLAANERKTTTCS